jgi:hypothetical protein
MAETAEEKLARFETVIGKQSGSGALEEGRPTERP